MPIEICATAMAVALTSANRRDASVRQKPASGPANKMPRRPPTPACHRTDNPPPVQAERHQQHDRKFG